MPASPARIRVLGLGNDLLADDAFGLVAARALQPHLPPGVEVVCTSAAGLALLDGLEGATHLLVLDSWRRGSAAGTLHRVDFACGRDAHGETPGSLAAFPGSSPHCVGLFDALAVAGRLGIPMPSRIACLGVEPADCETVGGSMTAAVSDAVARVVEVAREVVVEWCREAGGPPA